jgi:hypothetical protein
LLTNDPFDLVAVNGASEELLANYEAKSGSILAIGAWLVVDCQQFAANRPPEIKNG